MKKILKMTILLYFLSSPLMAETKNYKKITNYENERELGLLVEKKDSEGFHVLKKIVYKENIKKINGNNNTYEIVGSLKNNIVVDGEIIITKKVF